MGTPQFAVPALTKLINDPFFEVVAVYSKPPKISGRGQKVVNSKIHDLALKHDIKVITPTTLKDAKAQEEFKNLEADAALVVAYGLILPKIILESTKFGIINIHPSSLPKFRGATPIQSTLLAGDDEIGVSIIQMDEGVDSGDIIAQRVIKINENDNYGNLAPKLSEIGAEMAADSLKLMAKNELKPIKQDDSAASFSKKFAKDDAKIDFSKSKEEIINQIRALSGFLTSFLEYDGEKYKIFAAKSLKNDEFDKNSYEKAKIGEVFDKNFSIKCKNGAIRPEVIQKPGKKPVKISDFLLGFRF